MQKNAMKQTGRAMATALAAGMLLAQPAQAEPTALAPHSVVAGKTIAQWTADWWTWAWSRGPTDNPFTEVTNIQAAADNGQSGPVYFLAGTTGGTAARTFNVPADKYLLLPMVNTVCDSLWPDFKDVNTMMEELKTCATNAADSARNLKADGISHSDPDLFKYREYYEDFSYEVVEDNAFGGMNTGLAAHAVADGYWLMLEPLGTSGPYTITYGGEAFGGGFKTEVQAAITGVPEPTSLALLAGGLAGLAGVRRRRG